MVIIYLLLGSFAGLLAGLFGIGGGLIIVPALIWSFSASGMDPNVLTHMAVGTSLATIIVTALSSLIAHQRKGAVNWIVFLWMTLGILFGTFLGSLAASYVSGDIFKKMIGFFVILLSIIIFLDIQTKRKDKELSKSKLIIAGTVISSVSAFFGIGGGTLSVPFLSSNRLEITEAIGTSAAIGLPIAILSTLGFVFFGWGHQHLPKYSLGFVYLPAFLSISLASMIFANVGARLAHYLPAKRLKHLFALFLICVGLSFIFF